MATDKLTENQHAVLAAAAAREGGFVWPLPEELGLKKGSAVLVMKALLGKGLVKERRARAGEPVWREDENGKPMTALTSRTGLDAVGATHVPDGPADEVTQPRTPRGGTKLATLVAMLGREEGATVAEMAAATGWQAHSVRGVMSGALVKNFGLRMGSEKVEGRGRVYCAARNAPSDER